jgi:hypothetical protein
MARIEAPLGDRGSRLALIFAAAYVLALFLAGALLDFTDDEGMLAYLASRCMVRAPIATFFFLKFRPIGALIGAPGAAFGWRAYLAWHYLLTGATLFLVLRAILRYGRGTLSVIAAIAVVLTSPVLFIGALSGHSNLEGIGFFALALNLVLARETFAATFVLSVLPFVRFEYAPWSVALGLYLLWTQPLRPFFRGVLPFPLLFVAAGALYHRDLLWMLHYSPSLPTAEATSQQFDDIVLSGGYIAQSLLLFTLVSPAWPLAFALGARDLDGLGKVLLVTLSLVFGMIYFFPYFRIFKFDHTPRYWLVLLPAFAIVLSRLRLAPITRARLIAPAAAALVGLALAVAVEGSGLALAIGVALAGPLGVIALARRSARAAVALAVALSIATFALAVAHQPRMRQTLAISLPKSGLEEVVAWIAEHRAELSPGSIYTDSQQLDALLAERDLGVLGPVRFLVPYDIQYELYHLLDKRNGQYGSVIAALSDGGLYGRPLWTCDLAAQSRFDGVLFVTTDDYRLGLSLPEAFLDRVSTKVRTFGSLTLRRARPAAPPPQTPDEQVRLFDAPLTAPCEHRAGAPSPSASPVPSLSPAPGPNPG